MSAKKKAATTKPQQTRNFPRTLLITDAAYAEFSEAAEMMHHCGHGTAASLAVMEWAKKVKAQYVQK